MSLNTERMAGISASTVAALVFAVFTVSAGFGVVLRLVPRLSRR